MAAVLRAEAGRNPYGRGYGENSPRAPMVQGPQQGLACDGEYRVEAGETGQT